jgi:hypothetical protein
MAAIDRANGYGPNLFGGHVQGAPRDGCVVAEPEFPLLGYQLDHVWLCQCEGRLASVEGHAANPKELFAQAIALKDSTDPGAPWADTFTGQANVVHLQTENGVVALWRKGVCEKAPPPRQWPPTMMEYFQEDP